MNLGRILSVKRAALFTKVTWRCELIPSPPLPSPPLPSPSYSLSSATAALLLLLRESPSSSSLSRFLSNGWDPELSSVRGEYDPYIHPSTLSDRAIPFPRTEVLDRFRGTRLPGRADHRVSERLGIAFHLRQAGLLFSQFSSPPIWRRGRLALKMC